MGLHSHPHSWVGETLQTVELAQGGGKGWCLTLTALLSWDWYLYSMAGDHQTGWD